MAYSIAVYEIATNEKVEYRFLATDGKKSEDIVIGTALKIHQTLDTPELEAKRREIAREACITYNPQTPLVPALLQLFSPFGFSDLIINGCSYNISPGDELHLVHKVLQELDRIDPAFLSEKRRVTHIGGNRVSPDLIDKISTIRRHICTPQHL